MQHGPHLLCLFTVPRYPIVYSSRIHGNPQQPSSKLSWIFVKIPFGAGVSSVSVPNRHRFPDSSVVGPGSVRTNCARAPPAWPTADVLSEAPRYRPDVLCCRRRWRWRRQRGCTRERRNASSGHPWSAELCRMGGISTTPDLHMVKTVGFGVPNPFTPIGRQRLALSVNLGSITVGVTLPPKLIRP